MSIIKGNTHFQMGIRDIEQLENVLSKNHGFRGIAFTGRSNVGKSSLINSLFGRKTAKTSKTPGRTREINVFTFEVIDKNNKDDIIPYILFDLPGYGHAEVSKSIAYNWNILMSAFFSQLSSHVAIINIQDARHPHQSADQEFHKFLGKDKLKTFLIFNKIDKLKNQKDRSKFQKAKKELRQEYKWINQLLSVSAESKEGLDTLEKLITDHCLDNLSSD